MLTGSNLSYRADGRTIVSHVNIHVAVGSVTVLGRRRIPLAPGEIGGWMVGAAGGRRPVPARLHLMREEGM